MYDENRAVYSSHNGEKNKNFKKEKTIHLGIDLFIPENKSVKAPLNGKVHTFDTQKYKVQGGFGSILILEHKLKETTFYTLYGHLSLDSFKNIQIGQEFNKGDIIGYVANKKENGAWPTHLHFQIIDEDAAKSNMFFGTTSPNQRKRHLIHFPDPNLILGINNISKQ